MIASFIKTEIVIICHNFNAIWTRLKPFFDDFNNEEKTIFFGYSMIFSKDTWLEIIPKHAIIYFYKIEIESLSSVFLSLKKKSFIKIDAYGITSIHNLLYDIFQRVFRKEFDGMRK